MTNDYAELLKRLEEPESWRSFPDIDDGAPLTAALAIRALVEERDRLREALEFYANPGIYEPRTLGAALIRHDLGSLAIAALGETR
jgi:hypothetical protein